MPRVYLSSPHMDADDRELLTSAFDSNWIAPLGPHVDAFETEFAQKVGIKHAAAVSSGTAALHLALRLLNVGPGDEVLVSTLTFAATVNPIVYQGANPVFIDSERRSWNMDPDLLWRELKSCAARGKLPKAVVVVDIFGQCADYDSIHQACAHFDVPIVEDAAEALGATYNGKPAGTFGSIGAFSFNGNKIITTSGGGMLVCDRADVVEKARFLATQARDPFPHYEHTEIGFNYRMSNLLAALGRGQLRKLELRVNQRRAVNQLYRELLTDVRGLDFMPEMPESRATFWLSCITIDPAQYGVSREDVRQKLAKLDIETRPVWKPMHMQPVFSKYRRVGGAVSEDIFKRGLCLPSGSNLETSTVAMVAEEIKAMHRI
jgi:dTDP-4-amino-4,6-dideoxygalactose transaminase